MEFIFTAIIGNKLMGFEIPTIKYYLLKQKFPNKIEFKKIYNLNLNQIIIEKSIPANLINEKQTQELILILEKIIIEKEEFFMNKIRKYNKNDPLNPILFLKIPQTKIQKVQEYIYDTPTKNIKEIFELTKINLITKIYNRIFQEIRNKTQKKYFI